MNEPAEVGRASQSQQPAPQLTSVQASIQTSVASSSSRKSWRKVDMVAKASAQGAYAAAVRVQNALFSLWWWFQHAGLKMAREPGVSDGDAEEDDAEAEE